MSCEFQSHAGVTEKKKLKFLLLLNRNEDLTIKYYAKKVLVHFRTCRLEKKWHSFLTSPTYKESLLEGALLVSQWGQVEHEQKKSLSEIEDIIDNISKRVRQLVDAKNSTGEAYSVLKTVRITLDCIKTVLYDEMGFTEMDKDEISNFDNVYSDKVSNISCFPFEIKVNIFVLYYL
jgi:F-box protein 21